MNVYRYPAKSLVGDYIRSLAGLGVGLGVLASTPFSSVIVIVFGGLTGLFLFFGARTVQRHILKVAITGEDICSTGFVTRVMPWNALEGLKLRYYGTRRRRTRESDSGGFMQLTLQGGGATVRLESSIDGFEQIARRAAQAARDNGVQLDPASAGNLLDIGIDADTEQPAPAGAPPLGH